eukprot:TRINITY_DN1706_c1_g1_i2.p1 TRINITY_DN1706_c1_g1~~TRINITY_DN1706_c1_g1_i2.p1  ORF type:complete len:368 (-),score=180.90 TRINITY_DN1706_c1_g1_i2:14-985(-)
MERYHADPRYQRLEDFFLSPAASTENAAKGAAEESPIELLSDDDVGTLMRLHVDDFESMKCRRGERQILELILNSYHNGLPLYDKDPVVKQHTARSIQFIFDFVIKQPGNVQKKILSRLADAFTACQAEQGRVLDAMYGSLSGRDKNLKDQIIAAVDEYKERVLDQVANELNPNAWKQDDSEPTKQLPHIMSSYKVAVGHDLALRGVKTAISDTNKFDLCSKKKKKVISTFRRLFDVYDIIQTFKNDVNQQSLEAERLIDRDQLSRWAGNSEENHGFPSHSIFFDEDHPEAYGESKPLEENMYQPFLSDPVTLDVFEHLFLKP